MSNKLLHSHSPFRIFFFSGLITLLALVLVYTNLGLPALFVAILLIIIEVTFSFENAIINAKVLATLSRFWQLIFLTIGIFIAIFVVRVIFPVLIVMLSAHLSWNQVVNMALHDPAKYAVALDGAHHSIAAFGGFFLVMLGLHYFLNPAKRIHWWHGPERFVSKIAGRYTYAAVALALLVATCLLPINSHPKEVLIAGMIGIVTYLLIHGLAERFGSNQALTSGFNKMGMSGFLGVIYLEILDASFSIDSVIGAFAITNSVVLIAAGLGVGAVWVRSLTIFMVRRGTLKSYRYLEQGAHYTILVLAMILLISLFIRIPEAIAGLTGMILIGISIYASIGFNRRRRTRAA